MTEAEAVRIVKQAAVESRKAINELRKVESEAKRIGMAGEYYSNLENCEKEIESYEVTIKALEKQVAKEPEGEGDFFIIYHCPMCKAVMGFCQNYCHKCGQKIDWQ